MADKPIYYDFQGHWVMIPESCSYDQGEPPTAASCYIVESDGQVRFIMEWTDAGGKKEEIEFAGIPNGVPTPFNGGDLADEMTITAVSPRELNSAAFFQGRELMIAQRQLDETGQAMRITQMVRLPDGQQIANVATYQRMLHH